MVLYGVKVDSESQSTLNDLIYYIGRTAARKFTDLYSFVVMVHKKPTCIAERTCVFWCVCAATNCISTISNFHVNIYYIPASKFFHKSMW